MKDSSYVVTGNGKHANGEWHTNISNARASARLASMTASEGGYDQGGMVWVSDEHGMTVAVYENGVRVDD